MKTIDMPLLAQRPLQRRETTTSAMSSYQLLIHRCLCLLIFTVIFEGLVRKMAPLSAGIFIFFFKDFVAVVLLLLCLSGKTNAEARRLLGVMGILLMLLFPCILLTAFHDPFLAIFGIKQYVIFPIVAVAMCAAYLPNHRRQLFSLFRLIALSVIVTTFVAVAQNSLPADHWLNLSVTGDDLRGFSAGGYLRVSSTFPFVGQYSYYLNALCYCLPALFCFNKLFGSRAAIAQIVVLIGLAIVGTFVTGSRGAVLGNAAILSAASLLLMICGGGEALIKVMVPAAIGVALFGVIQLQHPEFFGAYQARVEGTSESSHNIEIGKRVEGNLLEWTEGTAAAPPSFFGYGLGVMSNGSDKLSAYAATWRDSGLWTESDPATTFFEGGWYLVLLWYGFRVWVIIHSLGLIFKLRLLEFRLIACFAWGFILIIGITGTMAIQPPLTIWWWLAVGLIICLGHFESVQVAKKTSS